MPFIPSLRRAWKPVLAGVVLLSLAACEARPVESQSRTVDGLRLDYGVVDAGTVEAHASPHAERRMHGGPRAGADHVTLSVVDVGTNRRVGDAQVWLTVRGPHGSRSEAGALEAMTLEGGTTYGGYVSLPRPGAYILTFHVARPGRRDNPVRAEFLYERA